MHRSVLRFIAPLALALTTLPAVAADDAKLYEEARDIAQTMPPKLVNVLLEEIKKGGPEQAISVCRERAPKLAAQIASETGWSVRRVSAKNRNPKAVPDDWEKAALNDFEQRLAGGEPLAKMEKAVTVEENGKPVYRYIRPLGTMKLCLECHGAEEQIKPEVKARLKELYPQDSATGFSEGMIRGAITLKKPL